MILLFTKNLYPIKDSHSLFHKENVYSPVIFVAPLSHLTSCIHKNLDFLNLNHIILNNSEALLVTMGEELSGGGCTVEFYLTVRDREDKNEEVLGSTGGFHNWTIAIVLRMQIYYLSWQ
jgi:hypothetical protein